MALGSRTLRHTESSSSSSHTSNSSDSHHRGSTSLGAAAAYSHSAVQPSPLGLEANALCHRSHWVPKSTRSTCARCERPFRLWTKKHHCRLCGDVVCRNCSTQRILIQKKTLRSCDACVSVSVQRISELNRRNSLGDLGAEASAAAAAMALAGRKSDGALLRRSMLSQRSNSGSNGFGASSSSISKRPPRRSLSRRESSLSSLSSQSSTESALHSLRRRYRAQLPYVVVVFLLTLAGISNLLTQRA